MATLALIEGGSWLVLRIHSDNISATNTELVKETPAESAYSSPEVRQDLDGAKAAGYRFEPFLTYLPRAFSSKHVVVTEGGYRLNGGIPGAITSKIWVFGSSALYSVSTADNETIPAHVEQAIPGSQVRNFGVVGYNSLQDFIHLRYRLLTDKPDIVVIFSGVNDHWNAWLAPTVEDAMLLTNVMPRSTLQYFAGFEDRRLNWRLLRRDILSIFGNTVQLMDKAGKWMRFRTARGDIDSWKKDYRQRAANDLLRAKRVVPQMRKVYIDNLRATVDLAKSAGAKVVLIHQPLLFATTKPLVGAEASENLHPRLSFFALNDSELTALRDIPSYRLEQTAYWSLDYFLISYRAQADAVKALSAELRTGFVDAQAIVDQAGKTMVFTSPYHFTYRGTQLIANGIVPEINRQ